MTTTLIRPEEVASVPVAPMLTMFDPVFIGKDEFGFPVYLNLANSNLLTAGAPGTGKSGLLNTVAAHAALSANTRLVLFDGKRVELGQWREVADVFVPNNIEQAIKALARLQKVMDNRYEWLEAHDRRDIQRGDNLEIIVAIFDEVAYFASVAGKKTQQDDFCALLMDIVGRGRAAGIIPVAATLRPSFDIIPTSLRDLFGYRCAFRCTTLGSSNVILGQGWAEQGYDATTIAKTNPGEAFLLAEDGIPGRIKVSYLSDGDIKDMANYAAWIRGVNPAELQEAA